MLQDGGGAGGCVCVCARRCENDCRFSWLVFNLCSIAIIRIEFNEPISFLTMLILTEFSCQSISIQPEAKSFSQIFFKIDFSSNKRW